MLGEYPPMHLVTEQTAHTNRTGMKQFLLPIKNVGSEEFSVGIAHPFGSHKACRNGPTIQTTIPQSNQVTRWGHSDWEFPPLGILKSGTDVKSGIFGRNINNHTGVNPQDTPKPLARILTEQRSSP